MRLFTTQLKHFEINPSFLAKPMTLPYDLPKYKKDLMIQLVIYGLRRFEPSFFECNWRNIQFENKWNITLNGNKINLN
ncbi:MAG: hypothetical protein ACE5KT_12070, partial [Methanosarcinales archaeon]